MAEPSEERQREIEDAWRGDPKYLIDAIEIDIFELIPVMGQSSRFQAGLESKDEDFKMACGFTWVFPPLLPVRTIKYLVTKEKK